MQKSSIYMNTTQCPVCLKIKAHRAFNINLRDIEGCMDMPSICQTRMCHLACSMPKSSVLWLLEELMHLPKTWMRGLSKIRRNGLKLCHRSFRLDIRKKSFT